VAIVGDFRRPVAARDAALLVRAASWLAQIGARPNQVSGAGLGFALVAGLCLGVSGAVGDQVARVALLLLAASLVVLRGMANILDGLLAVEGGLGTRSGEIYNDLPDRFADAFILAGAGYSMGFGGLESTLGWLAALLAIMTAYVRVLGKSVGLAPDFGGPMAKPHRIGVVAVASVAMAGEILVGGTGVTMAVALLVVAVGCLVTIARRTRRVLRQLEGS
jgi:phosphatidylglycerophosphate synthase